MFLLWLSTFKTRVTESPEILVLAGITVKFSFKEKKNSMVVFKQTTMPGMKRDCGGAAAILGAFKATVKQVSKMC